jgi:hypothetical protein
MPKQRNLAIDRFRGMTIILMVIVNDLADVRGVPAILRHAPQERGVSVADLVSKFFIFAIAATFAMSLGKRAARDGKREAYLHFVGRYFAIMGIGALFGVFNAAWTGDAMWGTLQTIGLAGLLTLPVIKLPAWARALAGLGLLAGWQCLYHFAHDIFAGEVGALLGSFPMAAALMLSTAMIDLYNRGLKPFLIGAGALSLAAFGPLLLPGAYVTKENQVTFILICVAIACWVYLAFGLLSEKIRPAAPGLLCWWGENPMLLYVLHLMLTGAVMGLERPLWLAVPIDLAILSILSLAAWGMHRKKVWISL